MIPIPPLNISAGGGKSDSGDASTGPATTSFQFIKNLNLGGSGTTTQTPTTSQAVAPDNSSGGSASNMALYIIGAIAAISLVVGR